MNRVVPPPGAAATIPLAATSAPRAEKTGPLLAKNRPASSASRSAAGDRSGAATAIQPWPTARPCESSLATPHTVRSGPAAGRGRRRCRAPDQPAPPARAVQVVVAHPPPRAVGAGGGEAPPPYLRVVAHPVRR